MKLLDLSKRIDPLLVEVLEAISKAAVECAIPFFIVGATARDIFFDLLHNIKPRRATFDLDLGIHIAAWKSYDALLHTLLSTGDFKKALAPQRVYYFKNNFPIDIMPFGPLSGPNGIITWPDKKQMSILGFEESYRNCYTIKVTKTAESFIRVASPIGLTIMKLIARAESTDRAEKDARDLEMIFANYHSLFENEVRIFDFPDILELVHFDVQRSGTVLLGKDASAISSKETKKAIQAIIQNETKDNGISKLAIDMMNKNSPNEKEFENKLQLINDFKTGFFLP